MQQLRAKPHSFQYLSLFERDWQWKKNFLRLLKQDLRVKMRLNINTNRADPVSWEGMEVILIILCINWPQSGNVQFYNNENLIIYSIISMSSILKCASKQCEEKIETNFFFTPKENRKEINHKIMKTGFLDLHLNKIT